ncbi:ATP-binding protein [Hydrogenophaga sp. BPS33]|uniref:ATP-binding protein n=1 Tax=Hydrogenophaga sp. BPS33 TaxID=2651974 RepID=UPI001356C1D2|nr:ATP-binding protein [Hydrogenophaga sp. BPS33]
MNPLNSDTSSRPLAAWLPWLFALALWLLLVAVTALSLWQLHRTALDSQRREMALLSLALTDELDRGLRGAEEGLQALGTELGSRQSPATGGDTVQALRTREALMPMVSALWLLGHDRALIASSEASPVPDLQTFVPRLETLAPGATALSRPFAQADSPNKLVALAFRVGALREHPGGWIIAAIPANNLLGAFGVALPASDARMAIFRRDGERLAAVNVGHLSADEAAQAKRHRAGILRFSDGTDNLVDSHRVPRYGLDVVLSRELGAVLEGWRGALKLSVGALAFLLVTMAVAVHIVTRSELQRMAAQQALQVQLGRTSRLEALGALAGGVSHDFNNVLAGIVGYGEMAQDAAPVGSAQARHLDKVLQAAQRGKLLIERILSFSRGGARASTVFELEPVVEEVLTLLTASLRPGVVLERVLGAPGARLRGDATQVFEAVMNLCTNAMQAMPEGGMLSVQLERRRVSTPQVLSHSPLPVGEYLALSVSDQGDGITPDVMEHLFEPFFSARTTQTGTGLGLAVVFGVVAEFGGAIDVDSRPGEGARFTLYLPECTDALPGAAETVTVVPEGAGQRLLVVDDEPALLAMAEELLSGLGYEPVCFADARDALQAITEAPDRFAAVVTDEMMPGLSGTALASALREQAVHLPVVLVSGYGGALLARRASDAGVTRVLMKPLRRDELAHTLGELL